MKHQIIALPLLLSTLVISAPTHADPVAASFQRMLGHQPPATDYRYTSESGNDPLLDHLVASLARRQAATTNEATLPDARQRLSTATPEEPLAASFQRMLGHETGGGESQHTAETAPDPLLKQLTAALWPERTAATPERQP